jgi:RimJ/RimL family protein N-acetyltransferase
MNAPVVLRTSRGELLMRPERDADGAFLFTLFRSHALSLFAEMPVVEATKDALARMQFNSATATYRAQFAAARFDIIERSGVPIGRLITDLGGATACMVDYALVPDCRGSGLGTAIIAAVLEQLAPQDRPMRVTVMPTNLASLGLCARLGFRRVKDDGPLLVLDWRPPGLDVGCAED